MIVDIEKHTKIELSMKIGLAQLNTTVGDLEGNKAKIIRAYKELCKEGAEIVLFSELTVTGYSPRDLIQKSHFIEDNYKILEEIAKETSSIPAIVGYIDKISDGKWNYYYNAAAWCEQGKVKDNAHKCLLPSYGVFDETRNFTAGSVPTIVEWKGKKIGITICEDIWTGEFLMTRRIDQLDPVKYLQEKKVDLILNLSASPWNYNKHKQREKLLESVAQRCNCNVVYCNLVGGNDELVFDGRSFVANPDGSMRACMPAFEESLKVIDINGPILKEEICKELSEPEEIYKGLVLGLKDYAGKIGFKKAVIGLSGGIDSAVVACIAAEALGPKNVIGLSLPSSISSEHSRADAKILAKNLGIEFQTLEIQKIIDSAENALQVFIEDTPRDVTEENIQARTRGLLIMAVSNKLNTLVLSTGNKSELAVGYCTLYGDMVGGLAILSDVLKTKVYQLALYINRQNEIIPQNTIIKEPSAELSPGQVDQDSLPPYDILDKIIGLYIEEQLSSKKIIELGFDPITTKEVIRKIDLNEYKRKQAAPGLKISTRSFGIERRMPIVQKYLS